MARRFKIEALTWRHGKCGVRHHVCANYVVKASNPFEAIEKMLAKYPGRLIDRVGETWPNGNYILGKCWRIDVLNAHKEEIMIKYDLES